MGYATRGLAAAAVLAAACAARAADDRELPAGLSADQKANLRKFLDSNARPDRYVPKDATFPDAAPPAADRERTAAKDRPFRQYTVQITPHRPTPEEEKVGKADVYFYRPHPDKGKPGVTVKHTVDLATGRPVGPPEVLTKAHTPVAREELADAVALARERVPAVAALYEGRKDGEVRWEYLQMKINRKAEQFEPGDRVVRFVFTATPADGGPAPEPVRVLVNITRDAVTRDDR